MNKKWLLIGAILLTHVASAQALLPGFNGKEYLDILAISFQRYDSAMEEPHTAVVGRYFRIFQSSEVGLKNRWGLWMRDDNQVAVISIRGTVPALQSWLENFYSAMISATGSLQLTDSTKFEYQVASDAKAAVHVGWMIGLGSMAPTMLEQMRIAYAKGVRSFIVSGHSQGGALSLLATSYLHYLIEKGTLPKDMVIKSYCSAAPKVGNLYFAYDYDFITRNGWAFTIVNAADWVPESLFSIQRISDFNPVNPFVHTDEIFGKQKLLIRWYLRSKYNQMNRVTRKAQQCFEDILGGKAYAYTKKFLPQLKEPSYVETGNYQRAGVPIVLQPDSVYYDKFPNDAKNIFIHHLIEPYRMLAEKYYPE